jgi:replicative DNA helicase
MTSIQPPIAGAAESQGNRSRRLMGLASTSQPAATKGEVKSYREVEPNSKYPRRSTGYSKIKDLLPATFSRMEELEKLKGQVTGLATGLTDLDVLTAGMHGGEFIVVAGRPGMGKTAFALRIVENVAVEQAAVVIFWKMSSEQIVQRLPPGRELTASPAHWPSA